MDKLRSWASVFENNSLVYYVLAASVIELIAAGIICDEANECKDYAAWAVAAGAVSTGLTFIQALLLLFSGGLAAKIAPGLSLFLFLWWIPGAFVVTFKEPFVFVGNGYYASWAAFFFALMYFAKNGLAMFSREGRDSSDEPGNAV